MWQNWDSDPGRMIEKLQARLSLYKRVLRVLRDSCRVSPWSTNPPAPLFHFLSWGFSGDFRDGGERPLGLKANVLSATQLRPSAEPRPAW